MDSTYKIVPESIFEKYVIISHFFSSHDYSLSRFEVLRGINVNNIEISPMERTLLVAGIKSYLKQNDCELSDTTLKSLNIDGVTENELMAAPNLRCGYEQTGQSPQCMSIEHNLIEAILTHTMVFYGSDSSEFLNRVLLGKSPISRDGAKFLGQVLLQEPNLLLRIFQYNKTTGDTVFKEITTEHIIQSLTLNPQLDKYYMFTIFRVENLEDLPNAVVREVSQSPRKEVDQLFLEMAIDILQRTSNFSNVFNITINIKNDIKSIDLNHDINQRLLKYLHGQDIISLIKIASQSLNLINTPLSSRQAISHLEHQMSALGLEDQGSHSGSILPVEPLMDCHVNLSAETRQFS